LIVTWRIGGLRSSSQSERWIPEDGRTGFINGTRTIEEPNPLSIAIRSQLSMGAKASVDFTVSNLLNTPDEIIEQILATHFLQNDSHAPIMLCFIPYVWHSSLIVDTIEDSDIALLPHMWVLPKGRMTSRESWIVSSNFLDMPSKD
jgi:hypothetical protein